MAWMTESCFSLHWLNSKLICLIESDSVSKMISSRERFKILHKEHMISKLGMVFLFLISAMWLVDMLICSASFSWVRFFALRADFILVKATSQGKLAWLWRLPTGANTSLLWGICPGCQVYDQELLCSLSPFLLSLNGNQQKQYKL